MKAFEKINVIKVEVYNSREVMVPEEKVIIYEESPGVQLLSIFSTIRGSSNLFKVFKKNNHTIIFHRFACKLKSIIYLGD